MYKRLFLASALLLTMPGIALADEALPPEPQNFTLAVAIKTAMDHNPDILAAEAKVDEAKLDKQSQDLWWAHCFNASANYVAGGYNGYSVNPNGALAPQAAAGVGLNLGTLLEGPKQSARAADEVQIAEADLRKTTLAVAATVTAAYEAYESAKSLAAMNTDALQSADADMQVAQRQFTTGEGAINVVFGARLAELKVRGDAITTKGDVATAWSNLLSAMGTDVSADAIKEGK
ncbi:MAG TPA: TolC family protein [Oscillatoriaceae cyanobacterium]